MGELIIVGAGGFGREVLDWALAVERLQADWRIGGFLDANPDALAGSDCTLPVLGNPESFFPSPQQVFVCGIGDVQTRLRLCGLLTARGGRFVSIIHPTAIVSLRSRLGDGCVVCPHAVISSGASVGRFSILNMHCTVGHDAVIGDGCHLACHADVTGGASLGTGVFMGSHGSVLPKVRVGEFAVIGAGSVAYHDVPPRTTVVGVPARTFTCSRDDGDERSKA